VCYLWNRNEQGAVEKPEEQILLEDIARMTLNVISEYVVGVRRWASVGFLSIQK